LEEGRRFHLHLDAVRRSEVIRRPLIANALGADTERTGYKVFGEDSTRRIAEEI
jgi:hypothetical protein